MSEFDTRAGALELSVGAQDDSTVNGRDRLDVLDSLYAWLCEEDALRGVVAVRGGPLAPGAMGAALEVITVAVGSGGAVGVLARSVATWLIQGRRSDVKVTVVGQDGRTVEVDVRGARDPEALIRQVADLARRPAAADD